MGVSNVNVGVLGHVDSGKTSLCKRLSTVASTACFDKNPQSQQRGITLDLGFSSFNLKLMDPPGDSHEEAQVTLVDCPGHASLIRTIIGGASIIDLMVLVIDAVKGIQTQTAECIVLAEILCSSRNLPLLIVLNKTDLLPEESRREKVEKVTKKLRMTFKQTVFGESVEIVPFSCLECDNGELAMTAELIRKLTKMVEGAIKSREEALSSNVSTCDQFLFAVDHCFSIKGQGTVMTGTCLEGKAALNDKIEIAPLSLEKKIKSIQVFRKPVNSIQKGDRAGICVTQFDSSSLERGLVCYPGLLRNIYGCIMLLNKVRFFKGSISSNSKFHIVVGHETVMAKLTLFSNPDSNRSEFNSEKDEYEFLPEVSEDIKETQVKTVFMLLQFEKPILAASNSILIGSKLDSDVLSNSCRIAFYGKPSTVFYDQKYTETYLPTLKVFKPKKKQGSVDKIFSEDCVICKNMLKKESNIEKFLRLRVTFSTGDQGVIIGGFGQGGKLKVQIVGGAMSEALKNSCPSNKKSKSSSVVAVDSGDSQSVANKVPVFVVLNFKKMIFASSSTNKIIQ